MSRVHWRAGASTRQLALPDGHLMDGYGSRHSGATGSLHPLEVNALYLESAGQDALLVSLDLLAVDRAWVAYLRQCLHRRLGIRPEAIMVAASHTHAGPVGFRRVGAQHLVPIQSWRRIRRDLAAVVLDSVTEAVRGTTRAVITVGRRAVTGVAANRRDPAGPADLILTALLVRGLEGGVMAALWHFACHPTVLDADNRRFSPDLPGEVRARIRQRAGHKFPVIYLNGAAADVSTRFTRQGSGVDELLRLGTLAESAFSWTGETLLAAAPVGRLHTVRLPTLPPPDPAEAIRRVSESEAALSAARASGAPPAEVRLSEVQVMGARKLLGRFNVPLPAHLRADLQVLRLGHLALAAFPGELYAGQGLALAADSPVPVTLAVGYAGGYLGYLPPAHDGCGYESDSAVVAPGAGQRLVETAGLMLKGVELS